MRTPAAAEQVTEVANMAFQTWAAEIYSDKEAFAARHREFSGATRATKKSRLFDRK